MPLRNYSGTFSLIPFCSKTLLEHLETISDQHGTFSVLYSPFSDKSGDSKTYLVASSTLKRVTLRFGEYYRHGRDSSPANDHQRDLDAHNGPCALHDYMSFEP